MADLKLFVTDFFIEDVIVPKFKLRKVTFILMHNLDP